MYPSQAQRILVQNGPGAATREATQKLAAAADTASALQAVDRNLATAKAVPRSLQGDLGNEVREALFNTNLPKLLNRIQVCHGLYFFQFSLCVVLNFPSVYTYREYKTVRLWTHWASCAVVGALWRHSAITSNSSSA